jgi:hypothetical protein
MLDQLVPGRSIGGFGMFLPGIHMEVPEIGGGGGTAVAEPPAAPAAADGQPGAASDAPPGEAADDLANQPVEPPTALGLPDDPAFREFLAGEVNAILGAQLSRILPPEGYGPAAAPAGQPSAPGQGFDWSQLDPFRDDYGAQLGQGIAAAVQQAFSPLMDTIQQREQAAAEAARAEAGEASAQQMMAEALGRGPKLTEKGQALVRPLAETLIPQVQAIYGNSPRTAEVAIEQAIQMVRDLEREAAGMGAEGQQQHLAALAGAPAAAPAQAGTPSIPGRPAKHLSTDELINKWG